MHDWTTSRNKKEKKRNFKEMSVTNYSVPGEIIILSLPSQRGRQQELGSKLSCQRSCRETNMFLFWAVSGIYASKLKDFFTTWVLTWNSNFSLIWSCFSSRRNKHVPLAQMTFNVTLNNSEVSFSSTEHFSHFQLHSHCWRPMNNYCTSILLLYIFFI